MSVTTTDLSFPHIPGGTAGKPKATQAANGNQNSNPHLSTPKLFPVPHHQTASQDGKIK
jgi:hypothetical protein